MNDASAGLAVFGGTFDPVHQGHLASAIEIYEQLGVAGVHMVVAATPPHRRAPVASAADRLAMLEIAVAGHPGLIADGRELNRKGQSFSYDTLAAFRDMVGVQVPLYFVMGMDAFHTLPSWYRWQELTDLAHIVVIARPGYDAAFEAPLSEWWQARQGDLATLSQRAAGGVAMLTLRPWPVSATQVRAALQRGEASAELPDGVIEYIEARGLYGEQAANAARG